MWGTSAAPVSRSRPPQVGGSPPPRAPAPLRHLHLGIIAVNRSILYDYLLATTRLPGIGFSLLHAKCNVIKQSVDENGNTRVYDEFCVLLGRLSNNLQAKQLIALINSKSDRHKAIVRQAVDL